MSRMKSVAICFATLFFSGCMLGKPQYSLTPDEPLHGPLRVCLWSGNPSEKLTTRDTLHLEFERGLRAAGIHVARVPDESVRYLVEVRPGHDPTFVIDVTDVRKNEVILTAFTREFEENDFFIRFAQELRLMWDKSPPTPLEPTAARHEL